MLINFNSPMNGNGRRTSKRIRRQAALPIRVKRGGLDADRANRVRLRLIAGLETADSGSAMATKLGSCRAHNGGPPCWHALCPSCLQVLECWLRWTAPVAFRKALTAATLRQVRNASDELTLPTLTSTFRLSNGKFGSGAEQLQRICDDLHQELEQANIGIAIGLIQFTAIRDADSTWQQEFLVTLRAFIFTSVFYAQDPRTSITRRSRGRAPGQRNKRLATVKMMRGRDVGK